ncbi:MAG: hypothetical protein IPK16_01585 [Anaerolineales bacterium]|nr:hypothetical protein [Anaerolineales bacterium]
MNTTTRNFTICLFAVALSLSGCQPLPLRLPASTGVLKPTQTPDLSPTIPEPSQATLASTPEPSDNPPGFTIGDIELQLTTIVEVERVGSYSAAPGFRLVRVGFQTATGGSTDDVAQITKDLDVSISGERGDLYPHLAHATGVFCPDGTGGVFAGHLLCQKQNPHSRLSFRAVHP